MPKINKKAFGMRVAACRKNIGLGQIALGKALGMSQQGVANIESGKVARPRLIMELADILGTTPKWLLFGQGPEEARKPDQAEELASLVQAVPQARQGAAIGYLRQLIEPDVETA